MIGGSSRRSVVRAGGPLCAALLWAALPPGVEEVRAQAGPAGGEAIRTIATGGWGAVDAMRRPGTTVVSVTVALPVGSADDPEGAAGTAWLLADVLRQDILALLGPSARVSTQAGATVTRDYTTFRIVTVDPDWPEVLRAAERVIFRARPSAPGAAAARDALLADHTFERDSPVRTFRIEAHRALSGGADAWSREPRGTAGSVQGITATDLAAFRDSLYLRSEASVAVVGSASAEDVVRVLTGAEVPARTRALPDFRPWLEPDGEPAWQSGDRIRMTPQVTSTWIAVGYPVEPGTSRTALEMVAYRLDRMLNPDPPDAGLFHTRVGISRRGGRPLLLVEAVVMPEATSRWERRVLEAVEALAEEPDAATFRWHRRRFLMARLLDEAAPEGESLRRALDLLREGRVRDLETEIASLDAGSVRDAAARLGPPRILVYGPDLGEGEGG